MRNWPAVKGEKIRVSLYIDLKSIWGLSMCFWCAMV